MKQRKLWIRGSIVVVIVLIGWSVFISSKQIERNRRIQAEVSSLESVAAKLRRENETLGERISYFASSDLREQEAKKKLGLKKAEETVVVIKPAPAYEQPDQAADTMQGEAYGNAGKDDMPNYQKWWALFF